MTTPSRTSTSTTQYPIAIIGHKGKTGARVMQRLAALGYPLRGLSRSSAIAFDWERPETWPDALRGIKAAYVTYQPDLAVPAAEAHIREFLAVAKQAGIEHIVLLSGRGEDGAQRAEQILIDSGITWNVVRASWFSQNFSESFMLDSLLSGELALPADAVLEPFVDADDIADVAVAALTQPALHNQLFEVTGPRAITFAECVATIAEVTGSELRYTPMPLAAFIEVLESIGVPADVRWLLNELFGTVLDGRNTPTTDDVERTLQRPATDFRDYVKKAAATGVWDNIGAASAGAEVVS